MSDPRPRSHLRLSETLSFVKFQQMHLHMPTSIISKSPHIHTNMRSDTPLITRFMGPTGGPSRVDKTQVGPMSAPWTLLSGSAIDQQTQHWQWIDNFFSNICFACHPFIFRCDSEISLWGNVCHFLVFHRSRVVWAQRWLLRFEVSVSKYRIFPSLAASRNGLYPSWQPPSHCYC